jgi:hypothetical protein
MTIQEVYFIRSQKGIYGALTPYEEVEARNAGVIFREVVDPGPAVDRSGFDLKSGGGDVKVNGVLANEFYTFYFDVAKDQTAAEIDVFGVSGGLFFNNITDYVLSPGGVVVVPTNTRPVIGLNAKSTFTVPGPGRYSYTVKVDKPGMMGVQYNQR